jgi:hypothetical protein
VAAIYAALNPAQWLLGSMKMSSSPQAASPRVVERGTVEHLDVVLWPRARDPG